MTYCYVHLDSFRRLRPNLYEHYRLLVELYENTSFVCKFGFTGGACGRIDVIVFVYTSCLFPKIKYDIGAEHFVKWP